MDNANITIHCTLDGEMIQLSREAAKCAEALEDMMAHTESNVLPVELAAPPVCLVAAVLKHHAAAAAGVDGEAAFSLAEVELEALMSAMEAAHQLLAAKVFEALARELFRRMEGLDVETLREMLGVSAADAIPEADRASILAEPLFEPEGEVDANPEGGVSLSSSAGAAAPPALNRSMSIRVGSDDASRAAIQHAPTVLLRTLKAVSNAWKLRARRELCSRACPLATRPLNADGRPAPVPTRRQLIQGIDAEFLIRAGRPWDVVAAGQALPGLARLHGYGFTVDVAAARQADLEIDEEEEEEEEEEDEALDSVLRLPALRACITPEEGEVPRELLLAAIALAASGTVGGVPVQELREGAVNQLDLSTVGLGPASSQLIGMLLPVSASLTVTDMRYNNLDTESATMLANVAKEKGISLCGITPEQTEADFNYYKTGMYMQPADAILLTADLAVRASLTCIDVRRNKIAGDGASQLSAAVLGNTKIEVFNEVPIKEMRANSFTELNLSDKNIGVEGGMVVAGLLPVMASLTSVR